MINDVLIVAIFYHFAPLVTLLSLLIFVIIKHLKLLFLGLESHLIVELSVKAVLVLVILHLIMHFIAKVLLLTNFVLANLFCLVFERFIVLVLFATV